MSKISMTIKQIKELGLKDKVSNYKGWTLNDIENMSLDEVVEFDTTFEKDEPENFEIIYGKEYYRKDTSYCVIQELNFEYKYDEYKKYLVAYRNLISKEILFEIHDFGEVKCIIQNGVYK